MVMDLNLNMLMLLFTNTNWGATNEQFDKKQPSMGDIYGDIEK